MFGRFNSPRLVSPHLTSLRWSASILSAFESLACSLSLFLNCFQFLPLYIAVVYTTRKTNDPHFQYKLDDDSSSLAPQLQHLMHENAFK